MGDIRGACGEHRGACASVRVAHVHRVVAARRRRAKSRRIGETARSAECERIRALQAIARQLVTHGAAGAAHGIAAEAVATGDAAAGHAVAGGAGAPPAGALGGTRFVAFATEITIFAAGSIAPIHGRRQCRHTNPVGTSAFYAIRCTR